MTKVKKVNFSFDIHLGIGVRVTIRKNVIDGIDVEKSSKKEEEKNCTVGSHIGIAQWDCT